MADKEKVVDWDEKAEPSEFVVHPEGYRGMFVVTKDAELIKDGSDVKAVKIYGDVDGANVNEYLPRYEDKTTGKMGFNIWKIGGVLVAFGLRKHGDPVVPKDLLKIKVGKKAPCVLSLDAYGKCKDCGRSDSNRIEGACSCGGQIETRESNKIEEWEDKTTAAKPATQSAPTTAKEAADSKEPIEFG